MSTSATSPSIYVPGKVRTVQSPYYDTYTVASAGTVNSGGVTKMFGNVQGVGGIGPNITNMQQAFQLSGGESFLLGAFRIVMIGNALADVNQFMINNTCRLIIGAGQYYYCDAPAEFWAGGCRRVWVDPARRPYSTGFPTRGRSCPSTWTPFC